MSLEITKSNNQEENVGLATADELLFSNDRFDFFSILPTSSWWSSIFELGRINDNAFIPPLSARMPLSNYFGRFQNDNAFTIIAVHGGILAGFLCSFYSHPDDGKPWNVCTIVNSKYRNQQISQHLYGLAGEVFLKASAFFVYCKTWSGNYNNIALRKSNFYLHKTLLDDRQNGCHTFIYERCLYSSGHFNDVTKLGILGGMGACTSAKFLQKACNLIAQNSTEQQQWPIVLDSATDIPDRSTLLLNGEHEKLIKILESKLQSLIEQDCSNVIICCFSFHAVLHMLSEKILTKIVSLVGYTEQLLIDKSGSYLLLATNGSIAQDIFSNCSNLLYPLADDQNIIHELIYRLKSGESEEEVYYQLQDVINRYKCSGIVLGCTDLFLLTDLFEISTIKYEVINPLKVMCYDLAFAHKQKSITHIKCTR